MPLFPSISCEWDHFLVPQIWVVLLPHQLRWGVEIIRSWENTSSLIFCEVYSQFVYILNEGCICNFSFNLLVVSNVLSKASTAFFMHNYNLRLFFFFLLPFSWLLIYFWPNMENMFSRLLQLDMQPCWLPFRDTYRHWCVALPQVFFVKNLLKIQNCIYPS